MMYSIDINTSIWPTYDMRTTITLDEDVALTVKKEMRECGKTFKESVNDLIRCGRYFKQNGTLKNTRKPFKVRSFKMGFHKHLDYDKISELLEEIEGPMHR